MSLAAQFARISAAGRVRQSAGTEQPEIMTFTMSQTTNRPFFSADVLVIVALIIGAALFVSRALVAAIYRLLF